ncbi:MAG TPA: TIGR03618 family F420-dependent PPOX class oxidoreductase [Mycobacteriales bacterium]|jgi:PPOX class probable F420-dependent enzyme
MIPDSVRAVLDTHPLGHLVTLNPDGSPQVTVVWVGIEDDELVAGSIGARQKLRNVERDPRVAVSFETDRTNEIGLREYLVVHGRGRVTEGGAPELLQRLAYGYVGPGVTFPPMPDPPPGYVLRIAPERYGGVGPWT